MDLIKVLYLKGFDNISAINKPKSKVSIVDSIVNLKETIKASQNFSLTRTFK